MDRQRAQIISQWLLAIRGGMTQDAFLKDLRDVTGWDLKRSSLSKYENARAVPWPETLGKFERYAAAHGKPGPDFSPRPTEPPIDPLVAALDRQTAALITLVDELRAARTGERERLADMESTVDRLVSEVLDARGSGAAASPRAPHRSGK